METTLKELEEKLQREGKSGYAVVSIRKSMANRHIRIGYFKDCADWHHVDYEKDKVEFIKYVGWDIR